MIIIISSRNVRTVFLSNKKAIRRDKQRMERNNFLRSFLISARPDLVSFKANVPIENVLVVKTIIIRVLISVRKMFQCLLPRQPSILHFSDTNAVKISKN